VLQIRRILAKRKDLIRRNQKTERPATNRVPIRATGPDSIQFPGSARAGHGLGQAGQLVYTLPAGAVSDIVPVSSPNNVTGVINATTIETADDLAAPLDGTTSYYSALYNSPFSTRWFVITFGTDSSLTTGPG